MKRTEKFYRQAADMASGGGNSMSKYGGLQSMFTAGRGEESGRLELSLGWAQSEQKGLFIRTVATVG